MVFAFKKSDKPCLILVLVAVAFLAITVSGDSPFMWEKGGKPNEAQASSHPAELMKHLKNGKDRGNEITGEVAAWMGAVINLGVFLSLFLKGVGRLAPLSESTKSFLKQFNTLQKKYLMPLHYYMNPILIGLALLHWSLSMCRSTALPEWGLALMVGLGLLGLAIKFQMVPRKWLHTVYRWHTHPLGVIMVLAMLFIGHSIVD